MKTCQAVFPSIAISFCILAWTVVLSTSLVALPQGQSEPPQEKTVVQVEAKYLCMINNQRFATEQIAIGVDG